jgi:hypothetical protein
MRMAAVVIAPSLEFILNKNLIIQLGNHEDRKGRKPLNLIFPAACCRVVN